MVGPSLPAWLKPLFQGAGLIRSWLLNMEGRGGSQQMPPLGSCCFAFCHCILACLVPASLARVLQLRVSGGFVSTSRGCVEAMRCAGAGCASQEPAFGESFPLGLGLATAQKHRIARRQ